eukprot:scaffold269512_cov31-Tisochrysis_lutea.AAC.6
MRAAAVALAWTQQGKARRFGYQLLIALGTPHQPSTPMPPFGPSHNSIASPLPSSPCVPSGCLQSLRYSSRTILF